jgi:hypothetical protein
MILYAVSQPSISTVGKHNRISPRYIKEIIIYNQSYVVYRSSDVPTKCTSAVPYIISVSSAVLQLSSGPKGVSAPWQDGRLFLSILVDIH